MAKARKVSTLYLERIRELSGLTNRRFKVKAPTSHDYRVARELHAALFGKHTVVTYTERGYDKTLKKIVTATKKAKHFEPGIMAWDARDPAIRKQLYKVAKPKGRKAQDKLQEVAGQQAVHPLFHATVFAKRTIDGQDITPKMLRLKGGITVIVYGFVAEVVIPKPDDFDMTTDEDGEDPEFMALLEYAEEIAEEIRQQLKARGYYVGQATFHIMAGPHVYRRGSGSASELQDQHNQMKRNYNTRSNVKDRYETWFNGIRISVPFGLWRDSVAEGILSMDRMKQNQIKKAKRRAQDRARRVKQKRPANWRPKPR